MRRIRRILFATDFSKASANALEASIHKTALIRTWFAKRPRFHVHHTPTYGSWLSLVEDGLPSSP
jgi:hypothetical protein